MSGYTTLGEFVIDRQTDFQYATGELSRLLSAIRLAAKIVNREVNKAGLVDIIGAKEIGFSQIYFNPKNTPHNQNCDYEIRCLSEIKNIL